MSVANQANEKLNQLVKLTAQIESYLNPNSSKKGDKGDKGNKEETTTKNATSKDSLVDSTNEAMAIGGMATSVAKLIVATNVLNSKVGVKVKDFLVNFSEGLRDASDNLKQVNGEELIKSLTGLSKSLLSFSLGMTAIAVLSPAVALGTVVFSFAIRNILSALKTADDNVGKGATAIETLMGMGKSIATFALTMAGIAIVSPLFIIGTIAFTFGVKRLLGVLKSVDDTTGQDTTTLESLMSMGKSIAVFALAMTGIALVAPLFAIGTIAFTFAVKRLLDTLNVVNESTGQGTATLESLMGMGKSIALFALTMVGISIVSPLFVIGTIAFTFGVKRLLDTLNLVNDTAGEGTATLETLMGMGKSIAIFALAITTIGIVSPLFAIGTIAFTFAVKRILDTLDTVNDSAGQGTSTLESLMGMGKSITLFALAITTIGLVSPLFAIGTIAFTFAVKRLLDTLSAVNDTAGQGTATLESLMGMGKSIALFALTMVGISLVSPLFVIGTIAFTFGVKRLLDTLNLVNDSAGQGTSTLESLMGMGKSIALFALTMVGISIVSPLFAIGTITFTFAVKHLLNTLSAVNDTAGQGTSTLESLMGMGKSIALFALTMVGIALASPVFLVGVLVFSSAVKGVLSTLESTNDIVGKGTSTLETLMGMGKSIALFALTMVGISLVAPLFAIGTVVFTLAVKGILSALETANDSAGKGTSTLETLMGMGKSIALFALTMVGISLVAPLFAIGTIVFTLAVKGILSVLETANDSAGEGTSTLETLMGMGKSIALFALTMVGISLVAPLFAIGTVVFILAIKGILWALKTADDNVGKGSSSLDALTSMGKSIALFALTMVGIALVAPLFAVGVIVFVLSIKAILWALKGATSATSKGANSIVALMQIAKGVMLFALTMIAIGYFVDKFALGTLAFVLSISAIMFVLKEVGKNSLMINRGIKSVNSIVRPLLLFGLTMALAGLAYVQIALGAIALGLSIGFISIVINEVGKKSLQINRGVKTLGSMAKPLVLFGGVTALAGFVYKEILKGSAALAAAMVVIGLAAYGLGKFDKDIIKGSAVLNSLIAPMIGFAAGVAIIGSLVKDDPVTLGLKLAVMGAAIVGLGLAAYVLGNPAVAVFAEIGAGVLITLAASLVVFAGALYVLSKADFTKEKTDNLGYAIAQIGFSLAKFGLVAIPAAIGAAVLIPASLALLPLTYALGKFKEINWTEEDGDSLVSALTSTVQGFAHALDGVGVTGMIKLLAAIPVIALIGNSLVSLASGVKAMATLSFTEMEYDKVSRKLIPKRTVKLTDTEIQSVGPNVASILNALAKPLTEFGMWATAGSYTFGPFSIGSSYMSKGVRAAAEIGSVISSIAKGVADMAKLNVVDYEVQNGKIVPKSVRKLNNGDFTLAATNTALILNTLAQPLTEFGMWATAGTYTFGPFSLGSGYMLKGVRAAAEISNVISGLAKGVADMANLNVVDYIVQNGKLVPKAVRKLNAGDFTLAASNTALILSTLVKPLTKFGQEAVNGEGLLWGGGYVEKGIDAAAKVGNAIGSIAKGVVDMANLNIIEYTVKNGKLVPISTRKLGPADFTLAANNVSTILNTLTEPLTQFGKDYKNGSSWFTDSALEAGIEATGKIVDPIAKMAEMVIKLASGQATINEVINPGTKNAKLVAKGTINFSEAVPMAIANVKKLLYAFPQMFATLGMYINKHEDKIDTAIEFMPKMSSAAKNIVSVSKSYLAVTKNIAESTKNGKNIDSVLTGFASSLVNIGTSFEKMDNNKVTLYKKFASITEGMTKISTPFEKFTKTFGQFTKDMGIFVNVWDGFGKDNASNLKTYADSLKTIASVDAGKLSSVTKALKEQAQAQAALNNTQKSSTSGGTVATEGKSATGKAVESNNQNSPSAAVQQQKSQQNQQVPASQGSLASSVIARLEVTNLYINGKLQK